MELFNIMLVDKAEMRVQIFRAYLLGEFNIAEEHLLIGDLSVGAVEKARLARGVKPLTLHKKLGAEARNKQLIKESVLL